MKTIASDILWRNSSTGETQVWFMDGHKCAARATVLGETGSAVFIGPPWSIVGTGGFNGGGKADILWANNATGEIQIWFMNGEKVAGRATVLGETGSAVFIGPPWSIVGTGDFNGGGKADILWANSSTGEIQIWFMNGEKVAGRETVLGETGSAERIGPPWSIVGIGDFNEDGKADILWANSSTGEIQIWFMTGEKVASRATVLGETGSAERIGPPWSIVETGDFNGDGKADILWANSSTGEIQIWLMNGERVASRATVLGETGSAERIGPPWSIAGTGVFSKYGNGRRYYRSGKQPFFVGGLIGDKYAQLNGSDGWLGWPTSDELPFSQDGRVSTFEKGAIYWWPDTGAIELGDVSVRYKGLYCFGETDEASAADEPYVIFGVVPVPPGQPTEAMTQIYTDVDGGDSRPDDLQLYRGLPLGMALGVALMEHDHGDRDKYLEQVKAGVAKAGEGVAAACGALFGPEAVPICKGIWGEVGPYTVEFVNGVLGTDDDVIEKWVWYLTAKDMVTRARDRRLDFWGIDHHLESKLLSDGEASYKVYLAIDAV